MSTIKTRQGDTLEIVVTPDMVKAGLEELWENHFDCDSAYMVEKIFRAMAYESPQLVQQVQSNILEQVSQTKTAKPLQEIFPDGRLVL